MTNKIGDLKCPVCKSKEVKAFDHQPLSFDEKPIDIQVYFSLQCLNKTCNHKFEAVGTITHVLITK